MASATSAASAATTDEDDSATRPVPPELVPTSILPPSALPTAPVATPGATLGDAPPAAQASAQASAAPATPPQPMTAVLPDPVAPPSTPSNTPSSTPSTNALTSKSGGAGQSATRVVLFLALLAVVVGLILFTTGALGGNKDTTQTPTTPQATGTTSPGAQANTFTAPGFYTLTLMPDWQWHAVPTSDANDRSNTLFFDSSGQANIDIDVYVAGTPGFTASPQQADENALHALDNKAVTHPGQPAPMTYGGASFVADSADVTLPNGQSRHAVALAALHGSNMYLIVYSAPPADFERLDTTVFPTILRSFAFQS